MSKARIDIDTVNITDLRRILADMKAELTHARAVLADATQMYKHAAANYFDAVRWLKAAEDEERRKQ